MFEFFKTDTRLTQEFSEAAMREKNSRQSDNIRKHYKEQFDRTYPRILNQRRRLTTELATLKQHMAKGKFYQAWQFAQQHGELFNNIERYNYDAELCNACYREASARPDKDAVVGPAKPIVITDTQKAKTFIDNVRALAESDQGKVKKARAALIHDVVKRSNVLSYIRLPASLLTEDTVAKLKHLFNPMNPTFNEVKLCIAIETETDLDNYFQHVPSLLEAGLADSEKLKSFEVQTCNGSALDDPRQDKIDKLMRKLHQRNGTYSDEPNKPVKASQAKDLMLKQAAINKNDKDAQNALLEDEFELPPATAAAAANTRYSIN